MTLHSIPFLSFIIGLFAFLTLAKYLMFGFSIYFLAKKQSLKKSWMAFVPIARYWMGGLLSDDAAARFGKKFTLRIWLPILAVLANLCMTAAFQIVVFCSVQMSPGMDLLRNPALIPFREVAIGLEAHPGLLVCLLLLLLTCTILSLVSWVLQFVGAWQVLKLHDAKNAVLFLLLSLVAQLLFGFPLLPILLLCVGCRALKTQSFPPVELN